MMRSLFLVWLVAIVLLLAGASSAWAEYPWFVDREGPVHCSVRMADGGPLPADLTVTAHVWSRDGSRLNRVKLKVGETGCCEGKVLYGRVQLFAVAEGYAPVVTEPILVKGNEYALQKPLVLDRGFTATVRLTGRDGSHPKRGRVVPVLGLDSSDRVSEALSNHGPSLALPPCVIASDGTVRIPHCPSHPLALIVRASGYEHTMVRDLRLRARSVEDVKLAPAKPARGSVVDDRDGRPVADVAFTIVKWSEPSSVRLEPGNLMTGYDSESFPLNHPEFLWARSDNRGRVVLDMLRDAAPYAYWFEVRAEGYAPVIVGPIRAGEDFGTVRLAPPIQVSGVVHMPENAKGRLRYGWKQRLFSNGKALDIVRCCNVSPPQKGRSVSFAISGVYAGSTVELWANMETGMTLPETACLVLTDLRASVLDAEVHALQADYAEILKLSGAAGLRMPTEAEKRLLGPLWPDIPAAENG